MPYIPYGKQYIDRADIKAVTEVLKSDWLTQGPKVKEFESDLAWYCKAKYSVAVSSGTAALHLAILCLELKSKDEVITSPFTFLATSNSIIYSGARPVFADINYYTGNISLNDIQRKFSKRTRALMPIHFAGLPCDMFSISKFAKKNNLNIIEDASHALGAEYKHNGRWYKVGSCRNSDMTTFSFHPVKSITTGEGGAILTNDKAIYEKLLMLRSHGVTKDKHKMSKNDGSWYYQMQVLGFNYRLTDIQSALGLSQLKKLDLFINRRTQLALYYNRKLKTLSEYIELPYLCKNAKSAWHLYSIRLKEDIFDIKRKAEFINELKKNGVGAQVHYIPVHTQPYYSKIAKDVKLPISEKLYKTILSIPIHTSMRIKDADYVVKILKDIIIKYHRK